MASIHRESNDGTIEDTPIENIAEAECPMLQPFESADEHTASNHTVHWLFISHTLSTFNSRTFEFGAVLYLASIFPGTLLPVSVYVIFRNCCAIISAAAVGRWIDGGERLKVVRTSIVGGRLVVATSCVIFWVLDKDSRMSRVLAYGLFSLLIALACAEKVLGTVNMVAVERDWAVVISRDNEATLRGLNAQMRRIDLICKLSGPFSIALLDGYSTGLAIIVNLATNIVSLPIEYFAIEQVYKAVVDLREPKRPRSASEIEPMRCEATSKGWRDCTKLSDTYIGKTIVLLKLYFRHQAICPSFSLALLYFTVLSFSGQMVTYLASVGYTSTYIGIARTIAVVFEVATTWIGPFVMARIGPVRSGIWFINWQVLCLLCGVSVFWSTSNATVAATALVTGTVLSRVGLWGFDMSAQIIVQEEVESQNRGSFSSMESSWQNAFEVCSYITTIIFSRPEQFMWPVLFSCVSVLVAAVLYTSFVRSRRGHLLHLGDCLHHTKGETLLPHYGYLSLRRSTTLSALEIGMGGPNYGGESLTDPEV